MFISEVYSNEIEDRIDAPFYQDRYLKSLRMIRKGIPIMSMAELIESATNGVEIRSYVKEGTPYLRVSDMKDIFVNLSDVKFIRQNINGVNKKILLNKERDILISRSGNVGLAAIVSDEVKNSVISSHIIKVRLNNKVEPAYLATYFNSVLGKLQVERVTNGFIVTEINHPSLNLIKVPIPPFQKQIANLIKESERKHTEAKNKIDKAKQILIDTLQIQLDKIKEEKEYFIFSSDLKDMFTPKFYYPLYVNTIKEIERKFETVSLGKIAKITRGDEVGSKNYKTYLEKEETDIPFIRTSDIVNNEIDNYPDFYISKKIYDELKQDIQPGVILYTKDGKIGLTAMIVKGDKCIICSGIAKMRVNRYEPYYIFAILDTFIGLYQADQRTVISSTLSHLRPERLEEIIIPIISEQKQKEISQLVKEAFELKRQKKELIKEAKEKIEEIFK